MPVLPYCEHSLIYHKELYEFLLASQENCQKINCAQIVSISLEIESVDPLVVLQQMAQPKQLNFYFETKQKGEAIAAIDAVAKLQLTGKDRFENAKNFINSCLANTSIFGKINHPFAGPHFFCSFSFFNESTLSDDSFPSATVFLPRWQVACKGDRCVLVANLKINPNLNLELILQEFYHDIQQILAAKQNLNEQRYECKIINKNIAKVDKFKQAVVSSLESIQSNQLKKIVLAQTLDVNSAAPFNLFQSLNNLRRLHPDCYVFSLSNGKGQNFIGASPERLISIRDQQLNTDALAGSAPRGRTATEDTELAKRLLESEKERHEHRIVIDFIIQSLYHFGIVPQLLSPRLRRLSNIQHLWTPIQAEVPASVHPLEIVAQLHPTPAVAGAERDIACAQIRRYESFERGLYAAPLGWVDYQGNSEFIVGIRSALINGDRARLYAGAGIVAGSDPDKELAEIQLKLQALLKALV